MIDSETRVRKPLQRVAGPTMATAEAVFKAAMLLLVPEDQTQRKAFETLMPYMYVLRNKGASWEQLTKILKDCGFNLQTSTVRSYYSEMLASRLDICQTRMNDQILLMAEVRKETKGTDVSAIAGRVAAIMEQQRTLAEPKIDAIFGISDGAAPAERAPQHSRSEPVRPARATVTRAVEEPGLQSSGKSKSGPPSSTAAKFDEDDAPAIPQLNLSAAPAAKQVENTLPVSLRCKPLQPGVAPVKRKEGIPDEVYKPGKLEHPAIPGLILTLDERLYGTALELVNDDGEHRLETADEKRFRIRWRKLVPMTETMTSESFTKIDETLFKKR